MSRASALRRRRRRPLLALGLAEPAGPAASDPNALVYRLLRLTGLAGALALAVAGVATILEARRRA